MYIKIPSLQDIGIVILDEEIYDRISDDNCPPREEFLVESFFNIDMDILGGYIEGNIASLFMVHDKRMHFMVLKKYRRYSRELLAESLKGYPHDIYVKICSKYKPVINFAKNNGFKEILIEPKTYLKNGCLYDDHTLIRS